MIGSNISKTFGQRRGPPLPPLRFLTKKDRQQERTNVWCVCYVYAQEFGREVVREAIMLDRSETGVRLRCRSRTPFPDKVRLRAPRLGLDIMARTVWQTGFDTGLAFEM
ncbi:MAG: hypothetical protein AAGL09_05980 [Pseudomonadota bacterium]